MSPTIVLVDGAFADGPEGETAAELAVDPAKLREVFAADLPEEQTAQMAATQRRSRHRCQQPALGDEDARRRHHDPTIS